ncbi:MAG: RNA 2',3'-cyclic phosphodiesterase [Patescibacteria group bacterium]|jgi:2'-5' RNA ligase
MKKKRIFISLNVSLSIKRKIAKVQKNFADFNGVRWEPRKKLHITLHFLNYLDNNEIEKVKSVLSKIKLKIFIAKLADYDFFPSKKQPRVVVLRVNSCNEIETLQKIIGDELKKYKFFEPEKRKYKAHLTIGRIDKITEKEIRLIENEKISGSWRVNEIDLMESVLRGKLGSNYKTLKKFVLN